MANSYAVTVQSTLRTTVGSLTFSRTLAADQVGTAYEMRLLNVQSDADGWTQYTKPTEMGTIKSLVLYNREGNANNVRIALSAAATYVFSTIAPGDWIKLSLPTTTTIFLSQTGLTTTTQDVEIQAFET